MAHITITSEILAGNLGDGWTDEIAAAKALADYTKAIWFLDMYEFIKAGHKIEIDIDIENEVGCSRDTAIEIDDEGDWFELWRQVRMALTDEPTIWQRFIESDEAEPFIPMRTDKNDG